MAEIQKDSIIAVAYEKMCQLGIRSVSISDICSQIGISKKTFYVYYSAKEDLINDVLRKMEQESDHCTRQLMSKNGVLGFLLKMQKLMHDNADVRKVPHLFYDLEKYYPVLFAEHLARKKDNLQRFIREFLHQGIDEHLFKEDLDVERAVMFISMLQDMVFNLPISQRENKATIAAVKYGTDIVIRGMISEDGLLRIQEAAKG